MKYKVIGWTNYDNYQIPYYDKTIGFAERNAIIDEIRKNRYLFSGWDHQESWENCVPILNDGKKRCFSQRGWGGVMAEAYGEMGDYDYAIYTFHESIKPKAKNYPAGEFFKNDFVIEPLENEHFDVTVSEELFNIAKKKNPFYLEDVEALRYLDENDTITLHCNNETLTFLVASVDRDKKENKFPKHHLIKGKYKVIVTHKPMCKVYTRRPMMILQEQANDIFKEAVKDYDFNTLLEVLDSFDLSIVIKKSKTKKVINTLKRFVEEYTDYSINGSFLNKLLYYIDDFEFSKSIAYKVIKQNSDVFVSFVNYYFKKGINVDEHIMTALKHFKGKSYYVSDLLLRAIELNPTNKSLRKKYYSSALYLNYNGFLLYMGINETKSLSKIHKDLIELDDFNKLNDRDIYRIAQLMSYPNYDVSNDKKYPYSAPSFFKTPHNCIKEGVLKYQEYVNEKYDLSNKMEELLLIGIDKACADVGTCLNEEVNASCYIYACDALSGFKFNLKDKAIKKYPILKTYIEEQYKQ